MSVSDLCRAARRSYARFGSSPLPRTPTTPVIFMKSITPCWPGRSPQAYCMPHSHTSRTGRCATQSLRSDENMRMFKQGFAPDDMLTHDTVASTSITQTEKHTYTQAPARWRAHAPIRCRMQICWREEINTQTIWKLRDTAVCHAWSWVWRALTRPPAWRAPKRAPTPHAASFPPRRPSPTPRSELPSRRRP